MELRVRGGRIGLAALGLSVAMSVLTAPAQAAGPRWLEAQPIEQNQNSIDSVSCPSVTTCLAAAGNPVVQDNRPSYEPDADSSLLSAVSCAPATRFCMFVDQNGGAFTYNSGTFSSPADIDGDTAIDAVSCPVPGFCMAIDHDNKLGS